MKSIIQHPADWSPYLDGEVADERYASLRAHLEECADCRREVERWRAFDGLFQRREHELEVPQYQWQRIRAELKAGQRSERLRRRLFGLPLPPRLVWQAAVAVALAGALFVARVEYLRVNTARQLAEVAQFAESERAELAAAGNPFRAAIAADRENPFARFQATGDDKNPFSIRQ